MNNNKFNKTPKPFCFNKSNIKAFVLGADPTNFSDPGKGVILNYVFGIGQDARYFVYIMENLKQLDLHLEDLYIQNLLPGYQEQETSDNTAFFDEAANNAKKIASEFNKYDPSKKLPVFLTAEDVYIAILNVKSEKSSAKEIYKLETEIPIPAQMNKLDRPAIPLFRHTDYELSKWSNYKLKILKHIQAL